jgi:carbon monoxide dehydrogenase subunit G
MRLHHRFGVPAGLDATWALLLDLRAVQSLVPGLMLDQVTANEVVGSLAVDIGGGRVSYQGEAALLEFDPQSRRVVIEVAGHDGDGARPASATVVVAVEPEGTATTVVLTADFDLAGGEAGAEAAAVQRVVDQLADGVASRFAGLRTRTVSRPCTDDPVHAGRAHARHRSAVGGSARVAADPVAAVDPVEPGDDLVLLTPLPTGGALLTAPRRVAPMSAVVLRPVSSPSVRLVRTPAVATPSWRAPSGVALVLLAVLTVVVWLFRHRRAGPTSPGEE